MIENNANQNTDTDIDSGMGVEVFNNEALLDSANKAKEITNNINELSDKSDTLIRFLDDDIHRIFVRIECGDRRLSVCDESKDITRNVIDILNNMINTDIDELKKYINVVEEADDNEQTNIGDN